MSNSSNGNLPTAIVGLDIGSSKISAAIGKQNASGKIDIFALHSVAIEEAVSKSSVINTTKTAAAIDEVLERIAEISGYDVSSVNVSISGENIVGKHHRSGITRKSYGREVVSDDLVQLAEDVKRTFQLVPGNEVLHILPQDFFVEGMMTDSPVGRVGVRLEGDFYIISGSANEIDITRNAVERVSSKTVQHRGKVEVEKIIFSPLATSLAVLAPVERKEGIALIDIGEDTTELVIYHGKGLRHVAVIPFGGSSITRDIREGCRILQHQAEKIKVNFANVFTEVIEPSEVIAVPGIDHRSTRDVLIKNIATITRERLREIASMALAEIIRTGYKDKLLGGVVLTGGSANIHGIEHFFQEIFNDMPVRLGSVQENLGVCKFPDIDSPQYANLVGLIMAGYVPFDERIDIFNTVKKATHHTYPEVSLGKSSSFFEKIKKFMTDDIRGDSYN